MKYLDKKVVSYATNLLTSSYYAAEVLYRVYGKKADVVYPSIESKTFFKNTTKKDNYVLSVGSLTPNKNHDFVIRCVAAIELKHRPILRVICPKGTDPKAENKFLHDTALEHNVKLEVITNISDDELALFYAASIATIYCPHLEPFGLVSLESIACGTPVLGVKEAGLRESIIDGETGFLLPWDEKEFAKKIYDLITNETLSEKMQKNCIEWTRIKRWRWEDTTKKIANLLNKIITNNTYKRQSLLKSISN